MDIRIAGLETSQAVEAATLFGRRFAAQRRCTPQLPGNLGAQGMVQARLEGLAASGQALVATVAREVVGFLGWSVIDRFRGTGQRGAYCPEWGHGSTEGRERVVYQALYAAAAARWTEAGCRTHAIATLAGDQAARETMFWNGFGMAVVDAVRGLDEIPFTAGECAGAGEQGQLVYRPARLADLPHILALDGHLVEYPHQSPILMPLHKPRDAAGQAAFLGSGGNTVWLAFNGEKAIGMLRLKSTGEGAAEIVQSRDTAAICGAYVCEGYRRHGTATALLNAALRWYRERGYARCSVDWESFNANGTGFWMRHFTPVCYSLIRHVECSL